MAIEGLGIARMGGPLTRADLESGLLEHVMTDYQVHDPAGSELGVWIIHADARLPQRVRLFARFVARIYARGLQSERCPDGRDN
jgi:hypothetical protein